MWRVVRVARTFETSMLEILLAIVKHKLFFWPNIFQRLEDNHVPPTDILRPRLNIRATGRIDESSPIAGLFCVNDTRSQDFEAIQGIAGLIVVDWPQISEIFVKILAFGDVYARLGKRAVSERTWAFDVDLAGDELLLELSIAFCAALRLFSIISVP